jgi:hypothetical protein
MIHAYGVFIPGAATPDERSIDALSRAAELSRIDAQMLLASPLPKRVRSEPTSSLAAERVRLLREGGFDAFVATRDALRRVKPVRIKAARFEVDALRFEPAAASFEPGGLRLIVHGEIRTRSRVVRTVRSVQDEGPPTVERVTEDRQSSEERFLHLYGEGHARVVEIRPQGFNFRALLGDAFGPVLSGNVSRFLERLREAFPAARYDDTLRRFPPMPDEEETSGTLDRAVCQERNEAAAMRTSTLIAIDLLRR